MATTTALMLVIGLATRCIVASSERTAENEDSLTAVPSLPLENETPYIDEPVRHPRHPAPSPEAREEFQADCEWLCGVCNLTGKVVNDSCKCLEKNGMEGKCQNKVPETIGELVRDGEDKEGDERYWLKMGEDEEVWGMRGERCILSRSRGALLNTLGQGLKDMPTEDRLAEFRKRVESLRRRSFLEGQGSKVEDKESNNPVNKISAPKSSLPISPFIDKPLGARFSGGEQEIVRIKENGNVFNTEESVGETIPIEFSKGISTPPQLPKVPVSPIAPVRRSIIIDVQNPMKQPISPVVTLPSHFLTGLKERMVDIEKIVGGGVFPLQKGQPSPALLRPLSFESSSNKLTPMTPPKAPRLAIRLSVQGPTKTISIDDNVQSTIPDSCPRTIPNFQEEDKRIPESAKKTSSDLKYEGPIMEGIIAVPRNIKFNT